MGRNRQIMMLENGRSFIIRCISGFSRLVLVYRETFHWIIFWRIWSVYAYLESTEKSRKIPKYNCNSCIRKIPNEIQQYIYRLIDWLVFNVQRAISHLYSGRKHLTCEEGGNLSTRDLGFIYVSSKGQVGCEFIHPAQPTEAPSSRRSCRSHFYTLGFSRGVDPF